MRLRAKIGRRPISFLTWRAVPALVLTALTACGAQSDRSSTERAQDTGFHGVVLDPPQPLPDFVLRDTNGRPFRFRVETAGQLTLLFFGYTSCPDICPVHMANLSAALERFAHEVRSRVHVVFVTTDPERDTPAKLRAWLDRFDRSYVGLTGSRAEIEGAQRAAGVPLAAIEEERAAGENYDVAHASQIIAYSPDGYAYVVYPAGVRQVEWASDLPRLLDPKQYLQHSERP